ncbi:unnamed protein product [Paramecium sonneborni]|uniref:Uncharacterized protein n=1 Tax=Paramecium sonneborni TaxID=65129 RepID=A0A8S1QXC9_9CILI|nr:unnamed protein product [Paramecium sonneborni]
MWRQYFILKIEECDNNNLYHNCNQCQTTCDKNCLYCDGGICVKYFKGYRYEQSTQKYIQFCENEIKKIQFVKMEIIYQMMDTINVNQIVNLIVLNVVLKGALIVIQQDANQIMNIIISKLCYLSQYEQCNDANNIQYDGCYLFQF